ncbi:hypothetical protein [Moorena sp. SIO4G3]|nr:hypothetical protein [Moorena sp. SIO4G3]
MGETPKTALHRYVTQFPNPSRNDPILSDRSLCPRGGNPPRN